MRQEDLEYLRELAQALDEAGRMGEEEDVPEGMRWISLSDTVARRISARLREICQRIEGTD